MLHCRHHMAGKAGTWPTSGHDIGQAILINTTSHRNQPNQALPRMKRSTAHELMSFSPLKIGWYITSSDTPEYYYIITFHQLFLHVYLLLKCRKCSTWLVMLVETHKQIRTLDTGHTFTSFFPRTILGSIPYTPCSDTAYKTSNRKA